MHDDLVLVAEAVVVPAEVEAGNGDLVRDHRTHRVPAAPPISRNMELGNRRDR